MTWREILITSLYQANELTINRQCVDMKQVIAEVAEGDVEDVNRAVKAARKAFEEGPWPKMPPHERGRIVSKFADLLEQHNDELAALDSLDSGKPYDQARFGELPAVVRGFRSEIRTPSLEKYIESQVFWSLKDKMSTV